MMSWVASKHKNKNKTADPQCSASHRGVRTADLVALVDLRIKRAAVNAVTVLTVIIAEMLCRAHGLEVPAEDVGKENGGWER
jgi:hypothetical protein